MTAAIRPVSDDRTPSRPRVILVGAGPGDPDLLTVKAVRAIGQADVVVHDRLVGDGIMALVPPGVARMYVGKASSRHVMPQHEINDLLFRLARSGRCVVRLKGGDPFIFGRGYEEADYLMQRGIAVEVIPGVTAASGCAAEFGIPLTHRGLANGVRFVTGHMRDNGTLSLDWDGLADPQTTLVVYMGLANLETFRTQLVRAGLPPDTPAAAIASGTTPNKQLCLATIATLPEALAGRTLTAPVLFVIGKVAALARDADALTGAAADRTLRHAAS